ncbi:MAG: HAMP domain-containing sensor histidine kinase [Chloroflexota bacterium]
MNSVTNIILISSILIQVVLLGYALIRRNHLKTGRYWLPATIAVLGVATAALFIPADAAFVVGSPYLLSTVILIGLFTAFSSMASTDLEQHRVRLFGVVGGVWAGVVVMSSLFGTQASPGTIGIVESLLTFSPAAITLLLGFAFASALLLGMAFYAFYIMPLPEVSNRALFWVFNSIFVLTGFALAVSGSPFLAAIGVISLTIGLSVATYSQISYRVFDIRNVLGLIFRLTLLTTITAIAVFAAITVVDRLNLADGAERTILAAVLAIVIAALYAPIREGADFIISKILIGEAVNAVEATRRYSQELSGAVEINELVEASSRTLNRVLRVRRSGMLLVSSSREDGIELATMRGGAFGENGHSRRIKIPADTEIYRQIVIKQKPITQFDIVFDPMYAPLDNNIRDFFSRLEMSAYAPIIMDGALIGLIACGTKINDTPLYQRDLELLVALANQTGVALRNTRLVADLRHLNSSMQSLNRDLGSVNDRMGKLDSVKTDFVTIASHELRTPLAQVRGYTDIIDALNDQGMLDQDQTRGLVNNLRKATERMEELISAMLDVSQLDVNAMDLRFAQTSPESVLRMAIEPLTDPIKQRKLTLSARGLRGLPPLEADMQRLVQAFRNVITNAIKFTPDGGRIDISAQFHEGTNGNDDYILISITDTGIGISKEHVSLVFNKFYRASDPALHSTGTYKFMGAGPGLGLTIAKGVIEGHGGKIWAESPGHDMDLTPGSTFFVKLPLNPPEDARRVLPFEEKEATLSKPDGKRSTKQVRKIT